MIANVYGQILPLGELPYIKKTGDTATGLIVFDGGITTNVGSSEFNGPVIINDQLVINNTATVDIDADVTLGGETTVTGPLVVNNTAEFNAMTTLKSEVDFGLWSQTNKTPNVYTNRAFFHFGSPSTGGGGGGQVDFEGPVSFGGFSSTTVSGPWNYGVVPTITAAMPSSSDSSTKIPTTAWVKSVVSNPTQNITANSLTILAPSPVDPTTGLSMVKIVNPYNTGGIIGFSGTGKNQVVLTGSFGPNAVVVPAASLLVQLECMFFNSSSPTGSSVGRTSCKILFFPNKFWQNWGSIDPSYYNINNKINGNDSFYYVDALYAPEGRPYWTYDQSFSGNSGPNALVTGRSNFFQILLDIPSQTQFYTGSLQILDSSALNVINSGVYISVAP